MLNGSKKSISPRLFSLTVTNTGNRKVKITDYGLYISSKSQITAVSVQGSDEFTLDLEESKCIDLEMRSLLEALKKQNSTLKYLHSKLKVYFRDSSGRIYTAKLPRSKLEYLALPDDEMFIEV